jgi:hypothetical protein
MANWKKIIVSGSDAHLASITSSILTNDNILVAGVGGAIESSGITFNGTTLGLGSSVITSTGATSILSGSFSGSFQGDGSGLTGLATNLDITGSGGTTTSVDLLNQDFTIASGNSISTAATAQTITVAVTDGGISATQLNTSVAGTGLSGGGGTSLSVDYGSSAGTAVQGNTSITGELTVDAGSSITLGTGGTVTYGLADIITGDRTFANNITIQGNLTVTGDTIEQQVTNLNVEDAFILLASGSAGPAQGGIIIDQGGKAGEVFGWDTATSRFATTGSLASNATSFTPDAFVAMVVDEDNGGADIAKYQKRGNIKVDADDDIWIYV